VPGFEPTESQLTIGAAHSLSTHKLQRDAGRGLGELHALQHLFDTEEEDYAKPTPRHVISIDDVTRGLGLDRELETLLHRVLDSTRTDFNRRSGNARLVGARGLLLSWLRSRGDEINAGLRLEIVRRADAYWRKRGAEDMRLVVKSLRKGERPDHKYTRRTPDGKGGYHYEYNEVRLSKPQLDRVLKRGNYSIISAGRNGEDAREKGMSPDHPEFHARHEKLRAELHKRGLKHTEVEGHYGSKEPSFIVYHHHDTKPRAAKGRAFVVHHQGPSEFAQIRKLGKKFNQDSVIHSKGGSHEMHYTTGLKAGKHIKGAGHDYTPRAEDMYTKVKTPGHVSKFALRFSWDALHGKKDAVLKADHVFTIGLRKSGEQAGHKYVRRTPDGKGGWSYEYNHEAAHADRIKHAQAEHDDALASLVSDAKAGKVTNAHGTRIADAARKLAAAHADTPDREVPAKLIDASAAADDASDEAYAGKRSHKSAAAAHWKMAEQYRLLGHTGYLKHETSAEDHESHEVDIAARTADREAEAERDRQAAEYLKQLKPRAKRAARAAAAKKSEPFIPMLRKSTRTLAVPTTLRPMLLEW